MGVYTYYYYTTEQGLKLSLLRKVMLKKIIKWWRYQQNKNKHLYICMYG